MKSNREIHHKALFFPKIKLMLTYYLFSRYEGDGTWTVNSKLHSRSRLVQSRVRPTQSGLISLGGRIFLSFPFNFHVVWINMHRKVEDRTTKPERWLEKVGPFNFKLLVVPHLKFWKWQCKIFSLQKLNGILVLFKTVKSIIVMAFRMFSKQA